MTSLFDITTPETMNFQLLLPSIPEGKLFWKPTVCSQPNLEGKIRSLRAILSNLQVIYQMSLVVN
jgi:hypothetical protein